MSEARFWTLQDDGTVSCLLCPNGCILGQGEIGQCRVRKNQDGQLIASNYGLCTSLALDPVEKKPIYHYHPGSTVLSAGTVGCNLRCLFCQNWQISRADAPTDPLSPDDLVRRALKLSDQGCIGIAYTYNEPVVWYEFVLQASRRAREAGLKNILVTNGYCHPEPWKALLRNIDAANIDVKGLNPDYYSRVCGGSPGPVMAAVEAASEFGVHVEITNLLVTGENDSDEDVEELARWLGSVSPDIPLHLSRYFPNYKFGSQATPLDTLRRTRAIAQRYLRYVYLGNIWPGEASDTLCYNCGRVAIERTGYSVNVLGLSRGRCRGCGTRISMGGKAASGNHTGIGGMKNGG